MDKVLIGMSGGVDSSAAARILLDEGYEVAGATVVMFSDDEALCDEAKKGGTEKNIADAKSVAEKLGIEHFVLDFKEEFKKRVMDDFVDCYLEGRTPNPCIECNRYIKFGKMLDAALERGFDYIATGHYALKEYDEKTGRYLLKRPQDRSKDQTYVLYNMTQHQLKHTLFPLFSYTKPEIRKIAEESGLVTAGKADSQDICFVPDGKYAEFIKSRTEKTISEGNFTDTKGNILGKHKGIIYYTQGQRKGLGIALGKPAFVVSKDTASNVVVLGDESDLYTSVLTACDVNFISVESLSEKMRVTAKVRYNQKDVPAYISPLGENRVKVEFDTPQRAVSPGQSVVFYDGDIVVGGGKIE